MHADRSLHGLADRTGPMREDLPLPTEPPFTAFVGNLAFDINEQELEEFFGPGKVRLSLDIVGIHPSTILA